jgi:ABC-type branched-subunit amino acid transport system ATPase component
MRRGKVTAAGVSAASVTRQQLATLMVGREVLETLDRAPFSPGETVLALRDIEAENDKGLPALRGVSLEIRAGEILGVAAVAGNGQSELAQVITGLRPCRGLVLVNGEEIENRPAGVAIRRGVAHVPEDRTGVGTAPDLSIVDNLIMKGYRRAPIARGWAIDTGAARQKATELKDDYEILAPTIDTEARLLSGGNLQRLILAREIDTHPQLMIAVQPTRGLDVGAIESVHRLLLARRDAGAATLREQHGPDVRIAAGDVANEEHVAAAVEIATNGAGALHGCVAAAGTGSFGPLLDMQRDQWDAVPVRAVAKTAPTLEPDEKATRAAELFGTSAVPLLVVLQAGRLVGTVTREDLERWVKLRATEIRQRDRAARRNARGPQLPV